MQVALILAGAVVTLLACRGTGRLFSRYAGMDVPTPVAFGSGAAILSTLLFALCALQGLSFALLPLVLLLAALAVWRPRFQFDWPALFFVPFGVWSFCNALAPEVSADGTYYHLTYVRRYLEHGGFPRITTNLYASLSQGLEMLFLPAVAIGGFSSAALVHFGFLCALAAAIIAYAKQSGVAFAGWIAAFVVFTSPIAALDASIAYNDVALAFFVFLVFWTVEAAGVNPRWYAVAGLLGGFCYAIKYTGVIALFYVLGAAAIKTKSARIVAIALACGSAMMLPWLVKNWIVVDNPLSPFFNRVFPNPYIRVEFEDAYRAAMRHYGGHLLSASTPLELTVRGGQLQGLLGPLFLLTPLALFAKPPSLKWRLLLAGVIFAAPWTQNLGTRFLIPAMPFFALALAMFLTQWKWAAIAAATAHAVSVWPPILGLYCAPGAWRISEFPWRAALRIEPEAAFITRRIDTYPIIEMINAHTQKGDIVYTALPLPDAYCGRTVLLDYASAACNRIRDAIAAGGAEARKACKDVGVSHLMIHRDEPAAKKILDHPEEWNVTLLAESGPGRLYRLN